MASLPRIPDLLTTANLACGVSSILLASQGRLTLACWLVFAAAVFDVLDGLAARALGGGTPLGVQLDSLADLVSFGVAPGFIAIIDPKEALEHVIFGHRDFLPAHGTDGVDTDSIFGGHPWIAVATLLVIAISSCWRLAKFNIDTRQTNGFLGLPTPANALFWASVGSSAWGLGLIDGPGAGKLLEVLDRFVNDPWSKLVAAILLGMLMLSELPLPSLKFKHFRWMGNEVIYLLGGISLVLVLSYGMLAVPMILLLYLLSPIWGRLFNARGPSIR